MPLESFRPRSLSWRLVRSLALAASLPLLAVGLFFLLRSERDARQDRVELLREMAKLYAYGMVERLDNTGDLEGFPPPASNTERWNFLAFGQVRESTLPADTAIFFRDATGRMLFSTDSFLRSSERDLLNATMASPLASLGLSVGETAARLTDIGFLTGTATLPLPGDETFVLQSLIVQPAALASTSAERRFVALMLFAAFLTTVLLVFSAVRKGLDPLTQMVDDTRRLSSGEIGQLESRGWELRELSAISTTVSRLIEARNRSHESMRLLDELGAKVQIRSEAADIVRAVLRNVHRVLACEFAGCVLFHHGGARHYLRLERGEEQHIPLADEHRAWLAAHRTVETQDATPFEPVVPEALERARYPIHVDGRLRGFLWADRARGDADEGTTDRHHMGVNVARQLEIALATVARSTDLDEYARGAITALARAIDAASPWTAGHSDRVSRLATQFGTFLGLDGDQILALRQGGRVHDIGKIGIDRSILEKPGPLTLEERREIERHPTIGRQILEPIPGFQDVLALTQQHHEWWNGEGYPHGRAGEAIDELARLLSVVDVFDSITSDRPYRSPFSFDEAVEHLRRSAGTQFEPRIVDQFLAFLQLHGMERLLVDSRSDDRQPALSA